MDKGMLRSKKNTTVKTASYPQELFFQAHTGKLRDSAFCVWVFRSRLASALYPDPVLGGPWPIALPALRFFNCLISAGVLSRFDLVYEVDGR